MFKLETLYATTPDKHNFLNERVNVAERLPIFAQVHSEHQKAASDYEYNKQLAAMIGADLSDSDSELEFEATFDMPCKKDKDSEICNSSLATSVDSASSDENPRKFAGFSPFSAAQSASEDELDSASDSEDIAISPRSFGIDFV